MNMYIILWKWHTLITYEYSNGANFAKEINATFVSISKEDKGILNDWTNAIHSFHLLNFGVLLLQILLHLIVWMK